jgi:Domain of unknown function (DUF4189)
VVAAALSSVPPAGATVAWVAASASPSTNKFDFSPGTTSDEAQQNVMDFCRSKGYPDCTFVISGQQCVGVVVMGGQVFGGVGATGDAAEQNAEQLGYSATGMNRGQGSSDCVTDF